MSPFCSPVSPKHEDRDPSGGRCRGRTYHVTLRNAGNARNVQSQGYLDRFS